MCIYVFIYNKCQSEHLLIAFTIIFQKREVSFVNGMWAKIYIDIETTTVSLTLWRKQSKEAFHETDGLCVLEQDKLMMRTGEVTIHEEAFLQSWK